MYVKQARKTWTSNEGKGFGGKRLWPNAEIYQHFYKRLGKDTKSLLLGVMVSWSKFEPGTPDYKEEASDIQSNFSTCNFGTKLKKVVVLSGQ